MNRYSLPGSRRRSSSVRSTSRRSLLQFLPELQRLETRQLLTNSKPAAYDDYFTISHDNSFSGQVQANDSDGPAPLTIQLVDSPSHGSLIFNQGAYTYTADPLYVGADSFTFKANDGADDSNTATVNIDVTNSGPIAFDDSISVEAGQSYLGAVQGNDADNPETITFERLDKPKHGTLVFGSGGDYTYTPDEGYEGLDSFSYKVTDTIGSSDTATVSITVGRYKPGFLVIVIGPCPCTPDTLTPGSPDKPRLKSIDAGVNYSGAPIRYFDGTVKLDTTDLQSFGFGSPWGQSRSWTNGIGYAAHSNNGVGMVDLNLPYLIQINFDNTVAAVSSGTNAQFFDLSGGTYSARLDGKEKLVKDGGTGEFILTDSSGNILRYYGFATSVPFEQRGQLKSYTDASGNVTDLTSRTARGEVAEVQRYNTTGSTTVTESFVYSYLTSGVNEGLLASVTLRRKVDSGSWVTVRKVEYAYYDGTASYGNKGDLKTATIKDGGGNILDVDYYRYYTPEEENGYTHGLKFFFSPASYARLVAAIPDPSTATDTQVAPYADNYFEYDEQRRVTKEIAQGFGCSSCTNGLGTYAFAYTNSSNADGFNSWKVKTVETLPDGNQNIVYTNYAGQVMLKVFRDTTSNQNWIDFWKYDSSGRIVLHASPSAVTGYNDSYADLLHSVSGNYEYLADSTGLIETTTYYTSGVGTGYASDFGLKRGELGAVVPQENFTYTSQTAGDANVVEIASQTVYSNDNGTGARTTNYAYTWFSGTTRMESMTVTYATIGSGQNGPGTADVETVFFNTLGQAIWAKDADGFLSYIAYDVATGAVLSTIVDVNTTQTSDFTNLPSGWSNSSGLHLRTRYEVDALGRETKTTDPNGNITYTVYNDASHEVRVYAGWNATTHLPTGPILVIREDRARSYTETLTMVVTPSLDGSSLPTGTEAIGSLRSLTREFTSNGGQVLQSDIYDNVASLSYTTSTSLGTEGVNFDRTLYSYDARGRLKLVTSPNGTLTKMVYDGLDRPIELWVGTTSLNLVKVREQQYDNGGIGDSNLTKVTLYPGGGADARVTQYSYDWRSRLIATKDGVQVSEGSDVNRPITYLTLNNLGEVTASEEFDGDGVTITDSNSDGNPDRPSTSLLRAKSTFEYDDQGQVFASHVFSVNQNTGSVSSTSLTTAFWYDRRGNLIKKSSPGGLVQKMSYDGAWRPVAVYSTNGGSDSSWSDAGTVTGDAVLEQMEFQYDANGNVLLITTRARFHDETATGALGTPSSGTKARVSFVASHYDAANRRTATVNLGTNNSSTYVWNSTIPVRSDTALVTSYGYDDAGRLQTVTDPRGLVTKSFYDARGRTTKTIEGYTNGVPTDTTNKTVEYTYDGNGNLLSLNVVLPGGGQQTTEYVYGVGTSGGSTFFSNDLVAEVHHPDKSTGAASGTEDETYTYNALGQVKTATDRNGTTHTYAYDVLGRQISDAITTPGFGIDQSILRLETTYDVAGRPVLLTSYDAASVGNVVNQVQRVYNGLGQLVTEYQAHGGAVNTLSSPKVQYAYSEMSGSVNQSRLVSMTYPNGRVLHYVYASGVDNDISRLSYLADDNGSGGVGTHLEEYSYLGLGTVVSRSRPEPGVELSYVKRIGESNGDAGDQYTGLDRFGRIVDQRWLDPATGTATDRFQYGYDRNGNRLYRDNLLDSAMDELYHASGSANGYDSLNQLTGFVRGMLSDSNSDGVLDTVSSPSRSQGWDFDALGNWESITTNGTPESRDHNAQNQVIGVGAATLTYDANGNMTTDETGRKFVYDGWNRLVAVKDSSNNPLVDYAYDALGRRISGDNGTEVHLYYSAQWQMLEERISGIAVAQNVWSPLYVDALVLRDRDTISSLDGILEERLYVQQDANWNVTAITDETGAVVERYIYDPYGKVSVLAANWTALGSSVYGWVYLHQGGRYDAVSELYSFRYRDFSSTLGRWTTEDPKGFSGMDNNIYRYASGSPATLVDPMGLEATSPSWYQLYPQYLNPFSTPTPSVDAGDTLLQLGKGAAAAVAGTCLALAGGLAIAGAGAAGGASGAGGVGAVEIISATAGPSGLAIGAGEILAAGAETEIIAITVEGGVATVDIGYLASGILDLVESVKLLTGARSVVLVSGVIENPKLARQLQWCVTNGRNFLGGVVQQIPGALSNLPEYLVKW